MLAVGFVFMVIQNYGFTKIPAFIRMILDEITLTNDRTSVLSFALRMIAYTGITGISMFLMRKLIIGVSRKIEYELRSDIFNKLMYADYSFYQKNQTGDLISRCTNDLNDVRTLLGPGIMYIPNSISRLALFTPVFFSLNAKLMIYIYSLMALLIVLIIAILPKLRPLFRNVQEHIGSINNRVWEIVSGIDTVKYYTLEALEKERFEVLNREYIKKQMKIVYFRGFLWPFFIFMFSLTQLVVLYVGGKEVIGGSLTKGELLQFNVMIGVLTFPVLSLGWVMSLMQQGISAMDRINLILKQKMKKEKRKEFLRKPGMQEKREEKSVYDNKGISISLKKVNYTYPNTRIHALRDISLEFRKKSIIGITGTIGCGKSTVINLISGIISPDSGAMLLNSIDSRKLGKTHLYDIVSSVPQNTFLFSNTVEGNISLGEKEDIDTDAVKSSAVQAGLAEEIYGFPQAYREVVGEKGITLSGGQKQRMAIARALYKDVPVLLLDDSLSSVDTDTEKGILANLNEMKERKTIIIVSHRISTLKIADRIYVMDKGRVVEKGTHSGLIQKDGLYAKLAKIQRLEDALHE
ncbi:ABC transporter ATP-binding protein [Spirochaetota bacterium]